MTDYIFAPFRVTPPCLDSQRSGLPRRRTHVRDQAMRIHHTPVGLELGNDARLLEAPGRQCNARSQTGSILTYLPAHTPMASLSVRLSLGRQAFGGSTCRTNQPSSLHMAFGPMGHVTARSFRCSWPMAFR